MARKFERLVALGEIKDGKLVYASERWVRGMLAQFNDCKITIAFERRKKSKSREQLGYLWGVVYPEISQHTGHTPEELHEIFKVKYLRRKVSWRGAQMTTVASTKKLSTGEMAEFIGHIVLEAGEMGIAIPDPDKLYQFKDEQ